jgi:competence protein ComEC
MRPAAGSLLFYGTAAAFTLGVLVRSFVPIGLPEAALFLVIAFAGALIARRNRFVVPGFYIPAIVFLAAAALGVVRMDMATTHEVQPYFEALVGEEVTIEGLIAREPDVRDASIHLSIHTAHGLVLVIADPYGSYAYGDTVRVHGELAKPESFTSDLGRTFNYPGYLHARGISYELPVATVETTARGGGYAFLRMVYGVKDRFERGVEAIIPEPAAGLGEGLLLGEKRALGDELSDVFRTTGIIHIVVLSGYNIMLVVSFVMYLLAFVLGPRGRAVVGVTAVVAFALLVGLSATVVRASVMAAILLFARATGETYDVLRSLTFAGIVMILANPYLVAFDTGFQLSFLATLGLILLSPLMDARLHRVPNLKLVSVREFLVATLSTQVFVLPILLYQMGEFSLVAVAVNVLVLPMVAVAMFLTFTAGMLAMVSYALAAPVAFLAFLSLTYILTVAERFAALPFASVALPPFPFWVVVVSYAVLVVVMHRALRPQSLALKEESLHIHAPSTFHG